MKLAPVVPQQFHGILAMMEFGMCFVEASVGYGDNTYLNHYRQEALQGKYIIVDNGMAETDYGIPAVSFRDVLEIADSIRADEVVMPDKAKDAGWTISMAKENARYLPERNRALVIHGIDWTDWTNCLHDMVAIGGRTLCVPKMYEEFPGGRTYALEQIYRYGYHNKFDIHLLGLCLKSSSIESEITPLKANRFNVRSIDTGAPVAFAQHDVSIDEHRTRFSLSWTDNANRELVQGNLKTLRRICF